VPEQFFLPAFTSKGIWNSAHFKNPEFDKLAVQYDTSLDEATRRSAAQQMAQLLLDETPAVIGYWLSQNQAVRKNVHGVLIDAAQFDLSTTFLA
jgi:peptide/nickel transport system substrate-binding protein